MSVGPTAKAICLRHKNHTADGGWKGKLMGPKKCLKNCSKLFLLCSGARKIEVKRGKIRPFLICLRGGPCKTQLKKGLFIYLDLEKMQIEITRHSLSEDLRSRFQNAQVFLRERLCAIGWIKSHQTFCQPKSNLISKGQSCQLCDCAQYTVSGHTHHSHKHIAHCLAPSVLIRRPWNWGDSFYLTRPNMHLYCSTNSKLH